MPQSEVRECPRHGPLVLRPTTHQTTEQLWCGTWFDCPHRDCSVLLPSAALLAQLDEQFQETRRDYLKLTTRREREKFLSHVAPWTREALIHNTSPYRDSGAQPGTASPQTLV